MWVAFDWGAGRRPAPALFALGTRPADPRIFYCLPGGFQLRHALFNRFGFSLKLFQILLQVGNPLLVGAEVAVKPALLAVLMMVILVMTFTLSDSVHIFSPPFVVL
jgi:hypothetical protein